MDLSSTVWAIEGEAEINKNMKTLATIAVGIAILTLAYLFFS